MTRPTRVVTFVDVELSLMSSRMSTFMVEDSTESSRYSVKNQSMEEGILNVAEDIWINYGREKRIISSSKISNKLPF